MALNEFIGYEFFPSVAVIQAWALTSLKIFSWTLCGNKGRYRNFGGYDSYRKIPSVSFGTRSRNFRLLINFLTEWTMFLGISKENYFSMSTISL
jgi:hypothetical protein